MKLYLVRHGESQANVAGIVNDDPHRSVDLTPRGRSQAAAAARHLRGLDFEVAYISRFPRARQTAEILLAALGLVVPLREDHRLDERRSGLDGRPVEAFNALVRPDPLHIRPEGGESFLEQMERVQAFIDDVSRLHPRALVLAVSHENPIQAALAVAGLDPEQAARGGLGNAEFRVLEWKP